jgi:tRNA threonylcarbamoyladenosine biosynthesis protein TsaB
MVEGLLLGIDTCGPSGSVALARLVAGKVEILGQKELAGRSYSSTLVASVGDLLAGAGAAVGELAALVVVSGPGSFTGVRVGLSTAKGLAEPAQIPVVAVSRLEVLAVKAGLFSAAVDAHRHEVFLRVAAPGLEPRELLAGEAELAAIHEELRAGQASGPLGVAVCDEVARTLLNGLWSEAELVVVDAPTAADAIALCVPRVARREFADVALLDGHYLRRSDAEIFGDPAGAQRK